MKKKDKLMQSICLTCKGLGYIIYEHDKISYSRPCSCLLEKITDYHLKSMKIPKSMKEKNLDNFIINNKSQEKTIEFLKKYIDRYPDINYGLLFMGPTGVGKTHLATGVLKAITKKTQENSIFIDASALLKAIKESMNEKNFDDPNADTLREVCGTQILLLDDLGSQRVSMWTQDIIKLIINHRYNNDLLTIITTPYEDKPKALGKESLEQRIGEINRSRLYEMCKTINIEGDDFRKMMINPRLI